MKIEERFNRVLAGLSHTGYTTEIEKCEARIFIEELYRQNKKYKEVIDKLNELIEKNYFKQSDDYYDYFTEGVVLQDGEYEELEDILNILKEVE